jgi:hypothetical protein
VDKVELVFFVLVIIGGALWALITYVRAFSGERVGAVSATEEELDGRQRYRIVVRRSLRGPSGLRIVHLVMGRTSLTPSAIFVLNQVEAAKAAQALDLAAQAAEQ